MTNIRWCHQVTSSVKGRRSFIVSTDVTASVGYSKMVLGVRACCRLSYPTSLSFWGFRGHNCQPPLHPDGTCGWVLASWVEARCFPCSELHHLSLSTGGMGGSLMFNRAIKQKEDSGFLSHCYLPLKWIFFLSLFHCFPSSSPALNLSVLQDGIQRKP